MVRNEGSSAGSYLADLTSPIPSHCASIVTTSTVRVNIFTLSPPRVLPWNRTHTSLEQSHLPCENTAHAMCKYAGQLEPLRHNFSSTRHPSLLGRQRQYGMSLPDTSTHDQQWESNPRPFDLDLDLLISPTTYPLWHMQSHDFIYNTICEYGIIHTSYKFYMFEKLRKTGSQSGDCNWSL